MAKKKTPEQQALEREVKKERKRARQLVTRATKRGFSFPADIVPDLPKTITEATLRKYKRLTPEYLYSKAVYVSPEGTIYTGSQRRVQERSESSQKAAETRKQYYESQARMDREYQDYLQDQQEREWTAQSESQQGYGPAPSPQSTLVLNTIRQMIENWSPRDVWSITLTALKKQDRDLLRSVLEGTIAREGEDVVAQRCEENAEELFSIVDRVLYDSGNSYKTRGVDGVNQDIQRFAEIIMGRSMTVRESMEFTEYGEQTGVYE